MNLPTIRSYGRYTDPKSSMNCMAVGVGPLNLWFSYQTLIAFGVKGVGTFVRENEWGPTTGKHMRWVDGGYFARQLPGPKFLDKWDELVGPLLGEREGPPGKGVKDPMLRVLLAAALNGDEGVLGPLADYVMENHAPSRKPA